MSYYGKWIAAGALALVASGANAGMYKCKDADGKTSYQAQPCESSAKEQKLDVQSSSPSSAFEERLARMTTTELMSKWLEDQSIGESWIKERFYVSKSLGAAKTSEANACLDRYRVAFKDPQSAYFVSADRMRYKDKDWFFLDVAARNALGGVARTVIACDA